MSRVILDVSTIARWAGPPVGIVRVEHELARHALRGGAGFDLCFHDAATGTLRALRPAWRDFVIGLDGTIDTIWLNTRRHRPAWRNLLSPRYPAVMALEAYRLKAPPGPARLAERVQRVILGPQGRIHPFADEAGRRQAVVPLARALGPPLALGPADTVLSAGSDWLHKGTALVEMQRRLGFRLAVVCYDLLPVVHPEWFFESDVARFRAYWRAMVPAATRILCNSQAVAANLRAFARAEGLGDVAPSVVPLGYAPPAPDAPVASLHPALRAGRYALFVSTVEPRKGHAVLVEAWRTLLAQGLPQREQFHLVLVGRRGWKTEATLAAIDALAADPAARLLYLDAAGDAEVARLLRDAAFCLYPSRAEGFGLPVIEAMAQGKAVIASSGPSVAETAAGLAPCLDPLDVAAWTATIGAWIADPAARAPWEARIRAGFRYATWPEAAERIMQAAAA